MLATLLGLAIASHSNGPKFGYETVELTPDDVGSFSAIGPSTAPSPETSSRPGLKASCREFPGTNDWPSEVEWKWLNASLGGVLLKPVPAAAACYPGPYHDAVKCTSMASGQTISKAYFDDPLALSTMWTAGNSCPVTVTERPNGDCTQGGFPVFVVNATSVKQVQIAVNFARNRNLRLVIK